MKILTNCVNSYHIVGEINEKLSKMSQRAFQLPGVGSPLSRALYLIRYFKNFYALSAEKSAVKVVPSVLYI